jgi:hypothetical protein
MFFSGQQPAGPIFAVTLSIGGVCATAQTSRSDKLMCPLPGFKDEKVVKEEFKVVLTPAAPRLFEQKTAEWGRDKDSMHSIRYCTR